VVAAAELSETGRVQVRCPQTVGRAAELAVLRDALAAVPAGGGLVLVTGPPGIGKSRLAGEVLGWAEAGGLRCAVGRATPADAMVAFRPLTQALLGLVRQCGWPPDAGQAWWRAPLAAIVPFAAASGPAADCGMPVRADAVMQLLSRLAGGSPAVLVLEDLHWSDPDTLSLLDCICDGVRSLPVLWVVTIRDSPVWPAGELVARWRGRRGVSWVGLDRLADEAIAEMVTACDPGATAELIGCVQRAAGGVPLIAEELLAATMAPGSFTQAVRDRLAGLAEEARRVVEAAAVLAEPGSWCLLPEVTGLPADRVAAGLDEAVSSSLLVREATGFAFRHSLTREAVAGAVAPGRRRELAAAALAAMDDLPAGAREELRGVAADLAECAGDYRRAGLLAASAGEAALRDGAMATAVDALRRAAALLAGQEEEQEFGLRLRLVQALTLAGHADEAMAEGAQLVAWLPGREDPGRDTWLEQARLALAEAAAGAERWTAAAAYLRSVPSAWRDPALSARAGVLAAEVEFGSGHAGRARELAERLLARGAADPEDQCRAQLLLGRIRRLDDLGAASAWFERALALARAARRPLQVLDALHELGTIEMFDHAGTARLLQARGLAEQLGAMGRRCVLDLQVMAACLGRFETAAAERHAEQALEVGERLGLGAVVTKALCGLAEARAQRRDAAGMERGLAMAAARDPDDRFVEAFAWGQCRGMLALIGGDWARALDCFGRGVAALAEVPNPEPLEFRALWPLLLARAGDPGARDALVAADVPGLTIGFANRGLLGYAAAILAGRAGDAAGADELARRADACLARFPVWGDLARLCAADAARAGGWGQPARWLADAQPTFISLGFTALARRCQPPAAAGRGTVTGREGQVLGLLVQGLTNKEIARQLHLSPRTVDKHVESLLRKSGSRSRVQLARWAGMGETT
jgi:DNA-binding CsgD family transcriptional regulator